MTTDTTNTTDPTTAVDPTVPTTDLPTIVEERIIAAAYINQAISKDGLVPHVIVLSGIRYGNTIRTLLAWAPQNTLTPESVAKAMQIPYDVQQGDFIFIEAITSANALIGIPDTDKLTVVRSTYQVQQTQPSADTIPTTDSSTPTDPTTPVAPATVTTDPSTPATVTATTDPTTPVTVTATPIAPSATPAS